MTVQELKLEIKALKTRAYKLKTKKAQQKAWQKVREAERKVWDILREQIKTFGTHSIKGTVRRFSPRDDHFLVDTPYGSMWCSPTCDDVSKSWYAHTCCVEYTEGQEIVIEIETDINHDGLFIELIPKRIVGGTLNTVQYDELCKRGNLAFFKYPNGRMSGFFAKGAI